MAPPIIEIARIYLDRGWQPIPIPRGQKKPRLADWPSLRLSLHDLATYFTDDASNIGVLLGEPSGGLIDVDLDGPEALELAPHFLPSTQARFGRPSKPASHWLYVASPPLETMKFSDIERDAGGVTAMLVELRSTGCQTVFPPSLHPSGERVAWDLPGDPGAVNGTDLHRMVTHLAVAALLARHWPQKGNRHEAALAAGGFLLRAGLDESEVLKIVQAAAHTAGDEEWHARGTDVCDTAASLRSGCPVTGGPRLADLLQGDGDKVLSRLRKWIGVNGQATGAARPAIDAGNLDLPKVSEAAWQALLASNEPPSLFWFGGLLARLEIDDQGALLIRPLNPHRLRYRLARVADWFKMTMAGPSPALPPSHVVQDMLARPDPPLPVLERIVETPLFTAQGLVRSTPGYDSSDRTVYAPPAEFSVAPVPDRPSSADIEQAKALLCQELLGDFPFVGEAERAHAISLLLLPFVRDLISGPTPLHLVEKPSPGTGGSLLADILTFPVLGRPASSMTEGRDEDEWRKRVTSKLLSGPTIVFIDNLRRCLDSAAVASAITATIWEDRRLGHSEMIRVPNRAAWIATGNNPQLSAEMTRRTVRIRLDARVDRPWLRKDFRHPDLRAWARAHRGALVWSALVLGQTWLAAGRPGGNRTLGMFEGWSHVMGGILATAGIPGFLSNLTSFYDVADGEGAMVRAFLACWWSKYSSTPVTVSELFALATSEDNALDLEAKSDQGRKVRLGRLLSQLRDRQYTLDGHLSVRVVQDGTRHRAGVWRLVRNSSGQSDD